MQGSWLLSGAARKGRRPRHTQPQLQLRCRSLDWACKGMTTGGDGAALPQMRQSSNKRDTRHPAWHHHGTVSQSPEPKPHLEKARLCRAQPHLCAKPTARAVGQTILRSAWPPRRPPGKPRLAASGAPGKPRSLPDISDRSDRFPRLTAVPAALATAHLRVRMPSSPPRLQNQQVESRRHLPRPATLAREYNLSCELPGRTTWALPTHYAWAPPIGKRRSTCRTHNWMPKRSRRNHSTQRTRCRCRLLFLLLPLQFSQLLLSFDLPVYFVISGLLFSPLSTLLSPPAVANNATAAQVSITCKQSAHLPKINTLVSPATLQTRAAHARQQKNLQE
jgi:hypothetical protein